MVSPYFIPDGPIDWPARVADLEADPRIHELFPGAWPNVRASLEALLVRLEGPPDPDLSAEDGLRIIFDEIALIDAMARHNLPLALLDRTKPRRVS